MNADELHRLVKLLADEGDVATLEEADRRFTAFGLVVDVGSDGVFDEDRQIMALTVLNCAARSFRGNVVLRGRSDVPLTVRGFEGTTLETFLRTLAPIRPMAAATWPTVAVGQNLPNGPRVIVPKASGWAFGLGGSEGWEEPPTVAASVAAAGLAVSEAFSLMRHDNPYAGHRVLRVDLADAVWRPGTGQQPVTEHVPPLWLVGLGHLGQAYSWALGFLDSVGSELVLQDNDETTVSTLSTSLLSFVADLGRSKTAVVADWLRSRGWSVRTVNQRFDHHQRVKPGDPNIALFGVDNASARRPLEGAGFRAVVDLGLGAGRNDFRAIRLRSFPGASAAAEIWAADQTAMAVQAPAYEALLHSHADACGVAMLASRAVGAPFVGCVAAAFALAAAMSASAGRPVASLVDLNLRDPQRMVRA